MYTQNTDIVQYYRGKKILHHNIPFQRTTYDKYEALLNNLSIPIARRISQPLLLHKRIRTFRHKNTVQFPLNIKNMNA